MYVAKIPDPAYDPNFAFVLKTSGRSVNSIDAYGYNTQDIDK